ncbi:MAG: hypothetical protein O2890_06215 [Cyanobacteria bacterium]|nr:hypothetical protein [Cyanobacteriota bacterium]
MPEVEFVGDWSQAEAEAIATSIQKSLGVGEGGGAEVTVQDLEDNPVPGLLSKRQKRLIDLWREAGGHAFESAIAGNDGLAKSTTVDSGHECGPDCIHDWDEVYGLGSLTKAVTGALRRDEKGRTYQFNANGRWQRFEPGRGRGDIDPELRFFPEDGEFGKGVYLQVGEPSGWLRVRLRIDAVPAEMLTDEQFYELENDLTVSTGLLLTNKGVKAIAKTEGDRVSLLMVRNTGDIEVMGAIANSGQLPQGDHTYRLGRFSPQDDSIVADVEVAPREVEGLSKAAIVESKRLFAAGSPLNGSPLVASDEPVLSRQWVRAAVDRCKLDGVNLDGIKIRLTTMRPDFLPETAAFCLPRDRTIVLVAHDPEREINRLTEMLTRRLQAAVRAEAIAGDEALDILHKGTCLTPEWWLEMLIKRYAGAIRCFEVGCVMVESSPEVWRHYLGLLGARGGEHWANRRAIAECMAEDYRVAHDPAGLPNLVTLPWDVAVPE